MPFNAGGQTYTGGALLAQGIGNLGSGIEKGIADQVEEHRKKEALTDNIMLQALETGHATPDDWLKYSQSNSKGKQDFAMRIASNFHDEYQQKMALQKAQIDAQVEARNASAAQRNAMADQRNTQLAALAWSPTDEDRVRAQATGNDYVWVPGKGYTLTPYGDGSGATGSPTVTTLYAPEDTDKNKPLAHVATFGKTMTVIGAGDGAPFTKDPVTGQWYQGTGKDRKALPPNVQEQIQEYQDQQNKALATPTPAPQGFFSGLLGGGATPAPAVSDVINNLSTGQAPTPTPTPTPSPLDAIASQIGGGGAGGGAMPGAMPDINSILAQIGGAGGAPQMPQTGNPLDAILQSIAGAAGGGGGNGAAAAPATGGKKLDKATAMQFLQQAGGDPQAARQLAKAAGYTF